MCFVENGDGSAPAAYGPVAGNLTDLQMLGGCEDVVCADTGRGEFGGVVVEDVLC